MSDSDVFVVDQGMWETMTEKEQAKYFDELLKSGKNFTLDGVKYVYDSNQGPVSWSWGGPSNDPRNNTREPQPPTPSEDNFNDESESSPLSKEQLKNLLSDFLGQLTTTKPPTTAIMEQPQDTESQQPDGPTLEELHKALLEGGKEKVRQLMTVNGRRMVPSPKDLALAYQKGGKDLLAALMANMDGDEEGRTRSGMSAAGARVAFKSCADSHRANDIRA